MKTAVIQVPASLDNIKIVERPIPTPGAHDVVMAVHATSLNFHDLIVASGGLPAPDGRVLMSDGAGEIVGESVTNFKVGDKVISTFFPNWQDGRPELEKLIGVPGDHADGFGAQHVCVPSSALTAMPKNLSFEEAATLPCAALTAWRAVMDEAKIQAGDTVLVQGTGGVSIFALQFAKAAGATVIATSSSDAKLEKLKALGADHVINYKDTPEWGAAAKALTGGKGVDEIVEIGGPGTLAQSIAAARIGGHISLIGVLTGMTGEVPTAALFSANITLSGITVGSHAQQKNMVAAIEANDIHPVIDKTFPLEDLGKAFAYQASQGHFGKIVVTCQS
jgi:NADPH:quinone reductase-like Zn-dependent oxidoreductase